MWLKYEQFIDSFNKYIISIYCVPGIALDPGNRTVDELDNFVIYMEITTMFVYNEQTSRKYIVG